MARPQRPGCFVINRLFGHQIKTPDSRGRAQMVENGLNTRKAVDAHHLFVVERTVGLSELRVPFLGHVTKSVIVGHYYLREELNTDRAQILRI